MKKGSEVFVRIDTAKAHNAVAWQKRAGTARCGISAHSTTRRTRLPGWCANWLDARRRCISATKPGRWDTGCIGRSYRTMDQKRIKGLCGAKPPQKPCWTNAVVLGVGQVVRNRGNLARVSDIAESARPGTYIRCNFHSARLAPELIVGAEDPFGNRSRFFKVLRISLSCLLCNEHRLFCRFCPHKRPQTIDQTSEFRKWSRHAASTA